MKRAKPIAALLALIVIPACGRIQSPGIPSAPTVVVPNAESKSPSASVAHSDPQPTRVPAQATIAVANRKILVRDCLLRLPETRRVGASVGPHDQDRLPALIDNDAATAAVLPATRQFPVDIVYHFGGAEVTPRELVVMLPESIPPDARTGRVELLVSSISAEAGFQFVRADPLENTGRVQRFRLRPQAARWAMLRFTPATGSTRVAVAEVALLGRSGPP